MVDFVEKKYFTIWIWPFMWTWDELLCKTEVHRSRLFWKKQLAAYYYDNYDLQLWFNL